jgi:predicted dehydrogenase/nucleoside-diphosphate-sugar epimerase
MTTIKQFRAGLVGAGYVSEFHIRALKRLADVQLVGITDLDPSRARTAAERFGLPAVFPSLRAMTAAGVNVVHVLTPPSAHAEVAMEALSLGCHVLVEKPLATSVEECDRIVLAARSAGRTVGVVHSALYDWFVQRALTLVRSGAIGDPITVDYLRSSEYVPYRGGPLPPQYRDGGYPFRDLGVHALYLLEAFLGEIREAEARFATYGGDPNLLYDEWQALVRCARGAGHIQLSWNVRPLQHVLICQGTRGVLRADLFSMTLTTKRSTPLPKAIERAANAVKEGIQISVQVPANMLRFVRKKILPYHGLQMLVEDFYRALAAGQPAPIPPESARPIVEWTERLARPADAAKRALLAKFPARLSATTLVTGASGFIGRHLVARLLEQNQPLRLFVRREPPAAWMNHPRLEVVLGDLGDPAAVERAVAGTEVVFHVGGAMSGGAHDYQRGCVAGTRNVVDSALRNGVGRLICISSLSVLHAAAAQPGCKITEDWPVEPQPDNRGYYSKAKLEAERLVLDAVKEKGLPAVILRPGRVFGPDATLLTPDVARRVKNRLVILGNGRFVLPYIYVEDLVDAILLAARSDAFDGSVFQLVDPAAVTQNELASAYIQASGLPLRITHVPLAVVYGLALGLELLGKLLGRPVPLSVYRVKSALAPLAFDCSAAERRLGWTPRIGVRAGLKATLEATAQTEATAALGVRVVQQA